MSTSYCTDNPELGLECKRQSFVCTSDTSYMEGGNVTIVNDPIQVGDESLDLIASLIQLKCVNNDGTQAQTQTFSPQGTTESSPSALHNCKNGISQISFWGQGADDTTPDATVSELQGITGIEITCVGESTSNLTGIDKIPDTQEKYQKKTLTCGSGQVFRGFTASYFGDKGSGGEFENTGGWLDVSTPVCENPAIQPTPTPADDQPNNVGTITAIIVGVGIVLLLIVILAAYFIRDPIGTAGGVYHSADYYLDTETGQGAIITNGVAVPASVSSSTYQTYPNPTYL